MGRWVDGCVGENLSVHTVLVLFMAWPSCLMCLVVHHEVASGGTLPPSSTVVCYGVSHEAVWGVRLALGMGQR